MKLPNIGAILLWPFKLILRIVLFPFKLIGRIPFVKKMNSNYLIASAIAIALVIWMASGMVNRPPPPEIDASGRSNTNIKEVLVKEFYHEPTERIIRLSGKSQEERKVVIRAELSAQVDRINVVEGAEVTEGFSILTLEQEEAIARLRQAEAAENGARLEFVSQERLMKQGLTSQSNLDRVAANYEAAKAGTSLARKQFESTEVAAPFAGRVENVLMEQGDFVQPGQALAEIFDYDPIVVVGDLSELEVNHINSGNEVEVKFITGETAAGEVVYVANTADLQSRTFEVQVNVPNPYNEFRAGITAELDFNTGLITATRIPASIISIDEDGKLGVKAIDEDNRVVFYPVDIVKAETNEMWVSDLPNGVKIITRGFGFVDEDEVVKATEE